MTSEAGPDERDGMTPDGAAGPAAREDADRGTTGSAAAGAADRAADGAPRGSATGANERRPLLERIGMAALALVIATLFGIVAVAAWTGNEPFLAVMAAIGALMTIWAAGSALVRG